MTAPEAAGRVRARLGARTPRLGIVLGSGLGAVTARLHDPVRVPYGEIPGLPAAGVAGHAGEFVAGTLAGRGVIVQSGRFHLYEGHEPALAALGTRILCALGVTAILYTNAAGGIRRTLRPGGLMLIADHLNFMFRNPLIGPALEGEARFPDMSEPYDPELRAVAREAALARGIDLAEGVYAAVPGPSYETPAEIRMLERLGGDAVGMSTVPEVLVARARGVRCLGVSIITNMACGIGAHRLSHDEVLLRAGRAAEDVGRLIEGVAEALRD